MTFLDAKNEYLSLRTRYVLHALRSCSFEISQTETYSAVLRYLSETTAAPRPAFSSLFLILTPRVPPEYLPFCFQSMIHATDKEPYI